jgi:hypothetical protein
MTTNSSRINLLIVLAILLAVALGCLGPSSSSSRCEGTVKIEGRTYKGQAKDEEQAGLNACNKFCAEEDENAKGMISIWLASDAAKEFERKMKRKPTREDAIIEDKRILEYVTNTCANKCKIEANRGKHTLATSCK